MAKVIFITGASRGFGKLWAEAFLDRGDKVVATARNLDTLTPLVEKYGDRILPVQLDVRDRAASLAAIHAAKERFGRIDVLINNAGYGLVGAIQEISETEARDQMETNFFGLLWITQAVIPVMREQGHGHIIQLSSILGLVGVPVLGLYNASKFAVEGMTESLAQELKYFGIHVSLLEPNAFSTDFNGTSAVHSSADPAYDGVKDAVRANFTMEEFVGYPDATAKAVIELVDSENPPLRLFLGKVGYPMVKDAYANRYNEWDAWSETANAAHGH